MSNEKSPQPKPGLTSIVFAIGFKVGTEKTLKFKAGPFAGEEEALAHYGDDNDYIARLTVGLKADGSTQEDLLWQWRNNAWGPVLPENENIQAEKQGDKGIDALQNYIEAVCLTLGINGFLQTEGNNDDGDKTIIALPVNSDRSIKTIIDHSIGMFRYMTGADKATADVGFMKEESSIMMFFILESILFAQAKSAENNKIGMISLDCLGKIDSNYLLLENFMRTAPSVGERFTIASLLPNKKNHEVSSIQAAKMLRLTGLSLISDLNLQNLRPAQRQLFVGRLSNDQVADIVVKDIQRLTDATLASWGVNNIPNAALRWQVEQSLMRIYSSSILMEYKLLKKEMETFDDQQKKDYLEMIKTMPDGNLFMRTRQSVEKIIHDATTFAETNGHEPSTNNNGEARVV